jgi:predicted RNA polymerase sigma factor
VALMLLHDSRRDARTDAAGELVLLEDQDRSRWDRAEIAEGSALVERALRRGRPGPYQLQAAIAAVHAEAATPADTDWPQIVALYGELARRWPSPVVALNHAVAIAMVDGPERGLDLLDGVDGLERYRLFHAARADLLRRLGRDAEAVAAYRRARELATNPAEQRFLDARLRALGDTR